MCRRITPELYGEVRQLFEDEALRVQMNTHEQTDSGHGRVEVRKCYAAKDMNWCEGKKQWKGLKGLVMVENARSLQEKKKEKGVFISAVCLLMLKNLTSTSTLIGG